MTTPTVSRRSPDTGTRLIAEDMAAEYQQARGWDISGYDLLEMRAELERRIAEARGSEA